MASNSILIIFNMQTGFGMLESGCVSLKNEVNIMMKNVVDVVLGGITYWAFGYGMSYGTDTGTSWFVGMGSFFVDDTGYMIGPTFTVFLFQMSFATTATTIVSGAIVYSGRWELWILLLVEAFIWLVGPLPLWLHGSKGKD